METVIYPSVTSRSDNFLCAFHGILPIFFIPRLDINSHQVYFLHFFENYASEFNNFFYCSYSCGYRKVFDGYVSIIQQKYPEITVLGANYDPPGFSLQFARFLSMAKMVIIFAIMTGANPFRYFGNGNAPPPNWWSWCVDNKIYACLMCFFLANAIEGQMMSTGAFEISLDDMPVWSKLETGRIPQPPELFQIIDNHLGLQFDSKLDLSTGFTK